MATWINKLLGNKYKKIYTPVPHKTLSPEIYDLFRSRGEGLYYACLKSTGNNIVAKAIAWITELFVKKTDEKLPISHCIIILYSENLQSRFTAKQWNAIRNKWSFFYGGTSQLDNEKKLLVMASADKEGMNYFDFSHYQYREFSLRSAPLSVAQQFQVVHYLTSIIDKYYDFTGLTFWWLYKLCDWFKWLEDEDSLYCSEEIYKAFLSVGFKIAGTYDPSPLEIENYNMQYLFYRTPNFLK